MTDTNTIVTTASAEADEAASGARAISSYVERLVVDSPATYEAMAEQVIAIKRAVKTMKDKRLSLTRQLDGLKSGIMDLFRPTEKSLKQSETIGGKKLLAYASEQRRIADVARQSAAAEQRRLDAEAEARAEVKRRAAAELAEAERVKGLEQAEAMEADGFGAVADAVLEATEEQAAEIEAQGAQAAAAEIAAVETAEQPVVAAPIKVPGLTKRVTWSAEVINLLDLCRAIGVGEASVLLVLPNQPALNAQARALKDAMNIPGCRAVPTETTTRY